MAQTRLQKEVQKTLAEKAEAQAALEALPDDAPKAIRRELERTVKMADLTLHELGMEIERQEKGGGRWGKSLAWLIVFSVIIIGWVMLVDNSPRTRSPAVTSGCQQWHDSQFGETIEICGNTGIIYSTDGIPDQLERWPSFDGRLRGKAYVMIDRIGSPNLAYVVQLNGNLGFWTGCESGTCRRARILLQK